MAGSEASRSQGDTIVFNLLHGDLASWKIHRFIKIYIYSIAKLDVGFEASDYFAFYFCSVVCMI